MDVLGTTENTRFAEGIERRRGGADVSTLILAGVGVMEALH